MPNHKLFIFGALALLAACAAKPPAPGNNAFACQNASECNAKWSIALAWAGNNAPLGIRQQTDNLIEVPGATDYNSYGNTGDFNFGLSRYNQRPGYTITRTSNPDGSGMIAFHADCPLLSTCVPSQALMRESLAAALGG